MIILLPTTTIPEEWNFVVTVLSKIAAITTHMPTSNSLAESCQYAERHGEIRVGGSSSIYFYNLLIVSDTHVALIKYLFLSEHNQNNYENDFYREILFCIIFVTYSINF